MATIPEEEEIISEEGREVMQDEWNTNWYETTRPRRNNSRKQKSNKKQETHHLPPPIPPPMPMPMPTAAIAKDTTHYKSTSEGAYGFTRGTRSTPNTTKMFQTQSPFLSMPQQRSIHQPRSP